MKKKSFAGLVFGGVLGLLLMPRVALANEGIVMMKTDGVSGACFVTSVFVDGTYRVLATCRDLKTALSPEQNRYVLWATQEGGKQRRLGEIQNGKLATSTDTKFTDIFLTAETDGYGNKPSENILISGTLQAIDFGASVGNQVEVKAIATPTPTVGKNVKVTPTDTVTDISVTAETPSGGVGGALSTVLKIALFGFGALLLIVGVFSFISRKRSL